MACLRGPNSWASYGGISGPGLEGAAPPLNLRDRFNRRSTVSAHRLVDRSAIETEAVERSLRESEERMSLAAEAANLGMWYWDLVSGEIWITDRGRALVGIGPETRLDNRTLISRVHPEDRAVRNAALKRAIETRGEYVMEYRVLLPNGTLRWIGARGHCMNVGDNKRTRVLGVSMDVTAQKQAQDALRESEARFRDMADRAPMMIWMSGTDKLCTFFNEGWLDFTGRPIEQEPVMGGQRAFTAKISTNNQIMAWSGDNWLNSFL